MDRVKQISGVFLVVLGFVFASKVRGSDYDFEQDHPTVQSEEFLPSMSTLWLNPDWHPVFFDDLQATTQQATGAGNTSEQLAKKLANPVADFISVQFQFNTDTGIGAEHSTKTTLNFQPVIPITLNSDWNLITRTIVPVAYQESPAVGINSQFGLGDTVQSFFFSPSHGSPLWGVGPVFLWPTATADILGSGRWGAGPTGVVLQQTGPWTYGMLANHIWSYVKVRSSGRPSVNATFLQPFISYTTRTATTFTLNTESTYDWKVGQWTVPINVGVSQLFLIDGKLPVQVGLFGRAYAVRPAGGPDWGVRLEVTFLLPR